MAAIVTPVPHQREIVRNLRKALRKLRRANGLLHEADAVLHDLPEHVRPAALLERIRLHLHAAEADNPIKE